MTSRIAANLYAVQSLSPIVGDTSGASVVYSCLPLDVDSEGRIAEDTRYITILSVVERFKAIDLMPLFDYARPITCQWLTYLWEVA